MEDDEEDKAVDSFCFFPFGGRLLRMTLFGHKSDDLAFFEVESEIVVMAVLLLPPSSALLVAFDTKVSLKWLYSLVA